MALIEHLEKLRYFQKVSQHHSINEAAEAMGVSQAGLSKSIAALESVLQVQLFIRSNQGLLITKEGELALAATKRILADAVALETNLLSLKAIKVPNTLTIGMYDSIAVYFFSTLSNYIKLIYNSVDLELLVDTSSALAPAVKNGQVEVAIGVNLDKARIPKSEFFLLFEDQYSFYVSTKIVGSFDKYPFIIHPNAEDGDGVSVSKRLAPAIQKRGCHQAHNFETIKALTLQGLGIGVMPTQVAKPLVQSNQLRSVQLPQLRHAFGKHNIGFVATEKFLQQHRDFAQDLYRMGEQWLKS